MANEIDLSLILITDDLITSENMFAEKLGIEQGLFKKKNGLIKKKNRVSWVLYSGCEYIEPIENHIDAINSKFPLDFKIKNPKYIIDGYVSLGVFCDPEETPFPSLGIPIKELSKFLRVYEDLIFDIIFYPSSE